MMTLLQTTLIAGLIAGALDIIYAIGFAKIIRNVSPTRLLQYIASGVFGKKAYLKGKKAALYGLLIHFAIALVMALVFVIAVQFLPLLTAYAYLSGPAYGLLLFVVMTYGVLPLTKTFPQGPPMGLHMVFEILSHMFLVGLPIALLSSR